MYQTRLNEYLDLQTFIEQHPQFNEGQMRWFVVQRKKNGLDGAIKRLGRRLYFHVPTFLNWVEAQSN